MIFNITTILIIALTGCAFLSYIFYKRVKKEDKEPPYNPYKDDPILHIRNKLFFEIAVEKIFLGYFAFVALGYLIQIILGNRFPEFDISVLYFSGITMFLGIYKMTMSVGVANKFSLWLLVSMLLSALIFVAVYSSFPVDLVPFLVQTSDYHLSVHMLGVAMGLGGTLVIDIMFSHFMKKYTISKRESVIMHLISQMIIFGLFLLILSGIALMIADFTRFNENPRFLMKMIVVLVVMINGGLLNLYLTPQMKKISLKEKDRGNYEKLTRISFALGAVSIVSWLAAFLLAMLKDLFNLPFNYLLSGYLALVVFAILGSQMAKIYYEKKEEEEDN
jgi:uncharacterized membrane protein YhdT